jgi:hypothetical protein
MAGGNSRVRRYARRHNQEDISESDKVAEAPADYMRDKKSSLSYGDSLGLVGIVMAIVALFVSPWWVKAILLSFGGLASFEFFHRSAWTHQWNRKWQLILWATFVLILGIVGVPQIINEWRLGNPHSISMDAFISLGYKDGEVINGIMWSSTYRNVRVSIIDIDQYPIQDLDLTVMVADKNTQIVRMAQNGDEIPDCRFHGPPFPDIAATLNGDNGDHVEIHSSDMFKGLQMPGAWWKVNCPTLPTGAKLDLMMATQNKTKAPPQTLKLVGSYQVALVPHVFEKTLSVR